MRREAVERGDGRHRERVPRQREPREGLVRHGSTQDVHGWVPKAIGCQCCFIHMDPAEPTTRQSTTLPFRSASAAAYRYFFSNPSSIACSSS